ncbi:DUF4229 domain-containing protein [Actinoplanes sp. NPDC051851]|uniref:DUF4229 domain-containing protein n=1 Tax=Actinoplanes sp. NPDC051851 TaxID=3154753 RepID=UPI0034479385
MNPALKYTLGRLGLFVLAFGALLPFPLNPLVAAMVAFAISAILSLIMLRGWRDQMADQLGSAASRRQAEKERLRSALAGDDEAAAAGDRVAAADAASLEKDAAVPPEKGEGDEEADKEVDSSAQK